MAEGELMLLGMRISPYVARVQMVLEHKGDLEEDLFNNKSELLKHNPIHKKVPVLIQGDRSICESLVILQYIDENWSGTGPNVLPADPYERAMARFWAMYIDDKLVPTLIGLNKATTEEAKAKKFTETLAALEHLEKAFKKCSGGKDFFGGDSIGFLDVTLGSVLTWIKAVENVSGVKLLDETKVPLLVQWSNCFLARDLVKPVLPSVEKLEEYLSWLQSAKRTVASAK